jgi:hypothetical protein
MIAGDPKKRSAREQLGAVAAEVMISVRDEIMLESVRYFLRESGMSLNEVDVLFDRLGKNGQSDVTNSILDNLKRDSQGEEASKVNSGC